MARDASLGRFFTTQLMELEVGGDGGLQMTQIVNCTDIAVLLVDWGSAGFGEEAVLTTKLSVDHGQGFKKIGIEMINKPEFSSSVPDFYFCVVDLLELGHNRRSPFQLASFQAFVANQDITTILSGDTKCLQLQGAPKKM